MPPTLLDAPASHGFPGINVTVSLIHRKSQKKRQANETHRHISLQAKNVAAILEVSQAENCSSLTIPEWETT